VEDTDSDGEEVVPIETKKSITAVAKEGILSVPRIDVEMVAPSSGKIMVRSTNLGAAQSSLVQAVVRKDMSTR